jgi:hypothetical protein
MNRRMRAVITLFATTTIVGAIHASTAAATIYVQPGAFVHHYTRSGLTCNDNEVLIGVHINQSKSVCARLNYGYNVASRYVDPTHGTQVPGWDPIMHGCAPNYVAQGLQLWGWADEEITCVSLQDNLGRALAISAELVDGFGRHNNGTQSSIYGLTRPTMHVCPRNYAMAGIHQSNNDLFCVG